MARVSAELAAGLEQHRLGRFAEAEITYLQILQTRPEDADVLCLLGSVRLALGNYAVAEADLRGAIRSRPNYPEAHNNLGIAQSELGQLDLADATFRIALRLRPGYAEAHNNLGTVLRDRGKLDLAEASFREALRLKPDYAEAHMNLGVALGDRGAFDEAVACYERALELHPDSAAAHMNLGNALRDRGDVDCAESSYQAALRIRPDYAEAHYNRALARLLRGDFEEGWQGYEWRTRCRSFPRRSFGQPTWDGAPLAGRTILLHTEQGFGDVLQFIRYAQLVKERGGLVVVECPGPLCELLKRSPGIDRLVAQGQPLPWFDVQAPLMSLGRILRTTLATIPANVPYVVPDSDAVERWAAGALGGRRLQGRPLLAGEPKLPRRSPAILSLSGARPNRPATGRPPLEPSEGTRSRANRRPRRPLRCDRPRSPARREGRGVRRHGGRPEVTRPRHRSQHRDRPPRRRHGGSRLDRAAAFAGMALDGRSGGQPMVSHRPAVPRHRRARLGRGLRANGGRAASEGRVRSSLDHLTAPRPVGTTNEPDRAI